MEERRANKFFLLSLAIHLLFFQLSGLIFIMPENPSPPPVQVRVIEPDIPKNKDISTGRIEDLPEPDKKEKPDRADVLSRFDSKGHTPEKGEELKASVTVIPRERIDPPAPAKKRKPDVTEKKKPKEPQKVAALTRPELDLKRKTAPKEFNPFSDDVIKKAVEGDRPDWRREGETTEAGAPKPSDKPTDRPNPEPRDKVRLSGLTGAKGSDTGERAVSGTGDVIDMGDEAIVSLNTTSFEYLDYFTEIKRAIELVWTYPEDAIIQGLSGKVIVRFSLKNTGELEDVRLVTSSGSKVLDDEAKLAVKVAAPYDAFPVTLDKKRLHIVATFVYQPAFSSVIK